VERQEPSSRRSPPCLPVFFSIGSVDKELPTLFSLVLLVVTVLTIFVLVLASIVGAMHTIASEITIREGPLRQATALWRNPVVCDHDRVAALPSQFRWR
jgi:hypothetical protein